MFEGIEKKPHIRKCFLEPNESYIPFAPDQSATRDFLREVAHFDMLPDDELERIVVRVERKNFDKGKRLAIQDATELTHLYIFRTGGASLNWEKDEQCTMVGYLMPGEIFGGISLLMNNGISLRTLITEEDSEVLLVPMDIFLELCDQHKDLSSNFVLNFNSNTLDTELDSLITSGLIKFYLSNTAPFSTLPAEAIDHAEKFLSLVHYPQGSQLFPPGEEEIGYLYLLHQGSAIPCSIRDGKKLLHSPLTEGDVYGASSILFNNGYADKSLEMTEDTYFYLLPKKAFISLYERYPDFREFFSGESNC